MRWTWVVMHSDCPEDVVHQSRSMFCTTIEKGAQSADSSQFCEPSRLVHFSLISALALHFQSTLQRLPPYNVTPSGLVH